MNGARTSTHAIPALLLAALPLLVGLDVLHSRSKAVEEGNASLKAGKAAEALAQYDQAAGKLGREPGVHHNRGAALYGLSRWDESAAAFLRATEAKAPAMKAAAFYNLGNALYQAKKYGEAVEAFKKSLAYDPADVKAKWNLELALRQKQEEDKQKQDQNDKKDQDNKDNKDGKDGKDGKPGKDQQAKNDQKPDEKPPEDKNKDDKNKDKQGDQGNQDKQAQNQQQEPKPQDQKEDQKQDQKQDHKQDNQQPQPSAEQQAKQDQAKQQPPGQAGQAGAQKPNTANKTAEMREVDAILDNLERSPKALEQELARVRALNRRPPAKDW